MNIDPKMLAGNGQNRDNKTSKTLPKLVLEVLEINPQDNIIKTKVVAGGRGKLSNAFIDLELNEGDAKRRLLPGKMTSLDIGNVISMWGGTFIPPHGDGTPEKPYNVLAGGIGVITRDLEQLKIAYVTVREVNGRYGNPSYRIRMIHPEEAVSFSSIEDAVEHMRGIAQDTEVNHATGVQVAFIDKDGQNLLGTGQVYSFSKWIDNREMLIKDAGEEMDNMLRHAGLRPDDVGEIIVIHTEEIPTSLSEYLSENTKKLLERLKEQTSDGIAILAAIRDPGPNQNGIQGPISKLEPLGGQRSPIVVALESLGRISREQAIELTREILDNVYPKNENEDNLSMSHDDNGKQDQAKGKKPVELMDNF